LHPLPAQARGAQSTPAGELVHAPSPSQTYPCTTVPLQLLTPHEVPFAKSSQAPDPLHAPVCWQDSGASATHESCGSTPARALPHTPSAPAPFSAAVHAWQRPRHAVLQQTPSTQLPEWQSPPAAQVAPSAWSTLHT
jgi:hypothetical protein